ncbi:DUF1989 domain-containing protein [Streptomyces sp. NPDC001663]|uniref:DUF1989 domain-containing protein n=1 Tax=Streptomyces sp. NPDC001663 TaxID=3364597 RepID=UPI0036BCFA24
MPTIDVLLNHQQLAYIDHHVDDASGRYAELVLAALSVADSDEVVAADLVEPAAPPVRTVVAAYVIEPGHGKAVEVRKGQILRIEQVEGGQTVDLNLFALGNRHERMHVALTRMIEGNEPGRGGIIWSSAPWHRPLAAIIESTGHSDTLFSAPCDAMLYAKYFASGAHLNCQQMQHEAQREYGLEPYELHDVFNIFQTFEEGATTLGAVVLRNTSLPGDYIELYAYQDLLAVQNVCGDDLGMASNYSYKPIRVVVTEALDEDDRTAASIYSDAGAADLPEQPYTLDPAPLTRDPAYQPAFPHLPIDDTVVGVDLDDEQLARLDAVWNRLLYPDDPGAALRDVLMTWLDRKFGSW